MLNGSASRWLLYRLGLRFADTQTTPAERVCLSKYAAGKKALVEIGVMHGATTALLRSVMDAEGVITGIDPHPRGRLGISFERLVAMREVEKHRRGRAILLRCSSYEAVVDWTKPIDFLFIDGDHSWDGIDRDWRGWSGFIIQGGIVALHDSRGVRGEQELDSVQYTQEIILKDRGFRQVDAVDSLTILQRLSTDERSRLC